MPWRTSIAPARHREPDANTFPTCVIPRLDRSHAPVPTRARAGAGIEPSPPGRSGRADGRRGGERQGTDGIEGRVDRDAVAAVDMVAFPREDEDIGPVPDLGVAERQADDRRLGG